MAEGMRTKVVSRTSTYEPKNPPPRRAQKTDADWPTNRTTTFSSFVGSATIVFDRQTHTVEWQTDHNNHAVDSARSSLLARVFFARLDKVRWTRGTGGVLVGNDEYNQGSSALGYGANYATEGWGYVGAERAPACTKPFVNSKGVRVAPRLRQW